MKKNYRIAAIAAGVIIIIAVILIIISKTNNKKSFQFVKVVSGDIESVITSTGTLNLLLTVNVNAEISGTISEVLADYNQKVKAGQPLARLDSSLLKVALDEAEFSYEKATVQLEQNERDYSNTKALYDQNYASGTDLETAKLNLVSGQVALKTAKSELEKARLNFRYATITSPIDGIIIDRNVEIGSVVGSGQVSNYLFTVSSDMSTLQIYANVDESDISKIKIGQPARFSVQTYLDRKFNGKVSQIRLQPTVIQNVVNYTVVVDVDNKEGLLLPGMTATADIIVESRTNVLKLPNAAFKFRPTQEMLKQLGLLTNTRGSYSRTQNPGGPNNSFFGGQAGAMAGAQGRGQFGGGSPNGGGGFNSSAAQQGQQNRIVLWTTDEKSGKMRRIFVKTGLNDGQMTEIEPLSFGNFTNTVVEGMQIISGYSVTANTGSAQGASPNIINAFGGGGRGFGR